MTVFNKNNFTDRLQGCCICPIECGADRTAVPGKCGAGDKIEISSWNLHFGEEPVISGENGSGTIFFAHCSLRCIFCQNYPISHLGNGAPHSLDELAEIMLKLQAEGAHNINLVTPTHYLLHIKEVLKKLRPQKLKIPVVYNCGGYEKKETLQELEGLVDIYMPDAKFALPEVAKELTCVSDYPLLNREALKEMYRQVGKIKIGEDGIMEQGMLVRHLVLPGYEENSKEVLSFLAKEFSGNIYLSLMAQYHPAYKADRLDPLKERLTAAEYRSIVEFAKKLDFKRGYFQDL